MKCEICNETDGYPTDHGWFCAPCREATIRKFRSGFLAPIEDVYGHTGRLPDPTSGPGPWPAPPGSIQVTLTEDQLQEAQTVGHARRHFRKAEGGIDKWNYQGDPHGADAYNMDAIGAVCEYALALHLGTSWDGAKQHFADVSRTDVAGYQIRGTTWADGNLLLHKDDENNDQFILARIDIGPRTVTFPGWCYGREGKRPSNWREKVRGRPCFFVPASALRLMSTL